jgi:hypothetical protein
MRSSVAVRSLFTAIALVVNRKSTAVPVTVSLPLSMAPDKPLRRYLYNRQSWPQNAFGDFWDPDRKKTVSAASFIDTIGLHLIRGDVSCCQRTL